MVDVGNHLIKEKLLLSAEKEDLPFVLLFAGARGVGKSTFAKTLARKLLAMEKNSHPDLHEYFPSGKAEMHSIESMHEMVEEMNKPPFSANKKVFILQDAERMLPTSANALLKSLEESTSDNYVILVSSEHERMLPTIISRCSCFFFSPLSSQEIMQYLQEKGVSSSKNEEIVSLCRGSITNADLFSSQDFQKKIELFEELFCKNITYSRAVEIFSSIDQASKDLHHHEIEMIASVIQHWLQKRKKEDFYWKALDKAMEEFFRGIERHSKLSTCAEYLYLWDLLNAAPDHPNLERSVAK